MAAANTLFQTPFGDFTLMRYPARSPEPLQAWCAADSLLLEEAGRLGLDSDSLLVVNDEHGALSTATQPAAAWTDSALSALAMQGNLKRNKQGAVPLVWSTEVPDFAPSCVLMRIPKQLPYLEYQLSLLAARLPPDGVILAAGMDKHLSPHTASILERYIGPTRRHRGQRKARLFSATRDKGTAVTANRQSPTNYFCDVLGAELSALPNVFSRDRLDPGSRLLLEQLGALQAVDQLVDLACGNGVLGLAAAQRGLAQRLLFCDESAMAIASARLNAGAVLRGRESGIAFHLGDGLPDKAGSAVDLILCNPPFHLNHAVDDFAGRRLLAQCAQGLHSEGKLCLVANRHLNYQATLRSKFHKVEKLAQNKKFIVWLAQKR